MLETTNPPVSHRTRRPDHAPRPASPRVSSAAASVRPRTVGNTALGHAQPDPRPAPRPDRLPRRSRLERSEMRLVGYATTCTGVVCGLLLLYLAAYAHVTQLGIDQAQARSALRASRLKNEMLRAERDHLQSPQRVVAAALALGMAPRGETPVTYVTPPRRLGARAADGFSEEKGPDGPQGNHGGTTADSRTAASFDH